MASTCLASFQRALFSRSLARSAQGLRPAAPVAWIVGTGSQKQQAAAPRLRVLSTAAQPYWADDSKPKVNVYSDYTIYKGKSAMSLKVIKPTWTHVGSGLALAREGTVLLEFANAVGTQKYDWENKATFALSAVECAAVLDTTDSRRECSFYHDPNKGGANEGSVQKTLSIKPAQPGSWFFTINVSQGSNKSFISCNVSDAELRLFKTVVTFLMPRLLGFDEHFAGAPSIAGGDSGVAAAAGGGPVAEAAPF